MSETDPVRLLTLRADQADVEAHRLREEAKQADTLANKRHFAANNAAQTAARYRAAAAVLTEKENKDD